MNPLFRIDFSISDSLKIVRKSVLIYETIIYGARPLKRTIQSMLQNAVADRILEDKPEETDILVVSGNDGKVEVKVEKELAV